ncbi:MAG: MBL fold metallo-hydrolase [Planctomycetota bacterium]|nr:MBL fold metallo-hydrolase [Planctomycetota bacterium]
MSTGPELSNFSFTFLGTGTSAGVPVIGCQCEVCTSDDQRDRRRRASICMQFTDGGGQARAILVDTSPDLRAQALDLRLDRCDAILFTHDHVDHTFGLDEVRRFNAVMGSSIDIYAEKETLDFLHRVYRHIFEAEKNINRSFVASLQEHELRVGEVLDLFGIRFTPIRLLHGRQPVLGFRIEALDGAGEVAQSQPGPLPLAYCTDVSEIPGESWGQLGELKTLVLDMLRPQPHPTHFSTAEAVSAAEKIAPGQTFFTHMTHDISHAGLELPAGMQLAHDGLVLS